MINIVVFEDENYKNFLPLLYTRHASELLIGGLTNLERILKLELNEEINLFLMGREYLADYIKNEYSINYVSSFEELNNYIHDDDIIGVNALIHASKRELQDIIISALNKKQVLTSQGLILAFSMKAKDLKIKNWSTKQLIKNAKDRGISISKGKEGRILVYPWNLISSIGECIKGNVEYISDEFNISDGDKGTDKVYLGKNVELEGNVFFDTSKGPIVIGDNVKIEYGSILRGPIWIRNGAEILTAKIKSESIIGVRCKIGSEIECSIVDDYTNIAHHGFIGHSYIGKWVNIGAQTTFSDLKNTYGTVKMSVNNMLIDSKLLKLGPFISDYVKLSIGTLVYSGKWIGTASHIYDIVNRDVPSFVIWTKNEIYELNVEKVIDIHKKMFKRRNKELKEYHKQVIYQVYKLTEEERRKAGVKKGYFKG